MASTRRSWVRCWCATCLWINSSFACAAFQLGEQGICLVLPRLGSDAERLMASTRRSGVHCWCATCLWIASSFACNPAKYSKAAAKRREACQCWIERVITSSSRSLLGAMLVRRLLVGHGQLCLQRPGWSRHTACKSY